MGQALGRFCWGAHASRVLELASRLRRRGLPFRKLARSTSPDRRRDSSSGHHRHDHLATGTKTPYTAIFDAADAGKSVYFIGLWENTKGETGPLSDVLRAIIPG